MAFGQRVETAAKVPPNKAQADERARSRSQDRNVKFEPSSILKKESNFSRDIGADQDANLVAVSDPNEFKFDDELTEPGDQNMPDEQSEAMKMVQSKQQTYQDSLDPRRPAPKNEDLAYNKVYTADKQNIVVLESGLATRYSSLIVVDFAAPAHEQRSMTSPVGAFSPQRPNNAPGAFAPQGFSVLPP